MNTVISSPKKYNHIMGIDISDKKLNLCVLDSDGETVLEEVCPNTQADVVKLCAVYDCPSSVLIAMESGTHSPWLSHLFKSQGFDVLVGNPRKLRAIWTSKHKTDARDALMLARIARFDRNLLYPIKHRSLDAHKDLCVLKSRDNLVATRSRLVSSVRGQMKCFGLQLPTCSAESFHRKVRELIPADLKAAMFPILDVLAKVGKEIKELDRHLSKLAQEKYPEAIKLQQINGVGPVTAMAFILTIEHAERFRNSRDVGPFLGLVPKKDASGTVDKELSISKAGNKLVRRLLVGSAQYILGHFGKDCDLRRFGEKLAARGGAPRTAKRKAVVATARKLAILMHTLWANDDDYIPFMIEHRRKRPQQAKAA